MNMKSRDILFGLALFVCLLGASYLAAAYFRYLSAVERLVSALLWAGMFVFLGIHFKQSTE